MAKLNVGDVVTNDQIARLFECSTQGGMRRSLSTNSLVLIADYTNWLYYDVWIGGTLHLTGTGQAGDQTLAGTQNQTLYELETNEVDAHLFIKLEERNYIYYGEVALDSTPYQTQQPDVNGTSRLVWVFPIKPLSNITPQPKMLVFSDLNDYQTRGSNMAKKFAIGQSLKIGTNINKIRGIEVQHKTMGKGVITGRDRQNLKIRFYNGKTSSFDYQRCIENNLLDVS